MAFNTGFLLPAITAIYSLFVNNDEIRLHILYYDLSDSGKIILGRLAGTGRNNTVEFIHIRRELLERIKVHTGRWRQEAFFRYYSIEMFPEYDRVLWLDADILVRGSIKDLYNTDLEDKSFAGVYDITSNPVERLGLHDYINSGVLVINLKKLRETGKMAEFWEMIASPGYTAELPDQDALNIVFEQDIKILDIIWNTFLFIPEEYADYLIDRSVIIHFISKYKPWKVEDTEYFCKVFEHFRAAEVFVKEYWDVCGKAVKYIE